MKKPSGIQPDKKAQAVKKSNISKKSDLKERIRMPSTYKRGRQVPKWPSDLHKRAISQNLKDEQQKRTLQSFSHSIIILL